MIDRAFTFRGTLGDITLCTRYALKEIRKVTGRINYFPKIYCLYHNHEDVNPATSRSRRIDSNKIPSSTRCYFRWTVFPD